MARRGDAGVPVIFPQHLGSEFSGVIDAKGRQQRRRAEPWTVGDEVIGYTWMNALA